jgi:hypothetical protein
MSQSPMSYQPYTPGRPGPEERPSREVRPSRHGGTPHGLVVASIVCVVVWAMSGFGYFWPVWVLLPTVLLGLGRPGRSWCRR